MAETAGQGEALMDRRGQAQRVRQEAQRLDLLEQARYFTALATLSRDANFEVVLAYWAQRLFLQGEDVLNAPLKLEDAMEQRFYWRLMLDLRRAGAFSRQLAAQELLA